MALAAQSNKMHSYRDRGVDLYETPSVATEALLEHEPLGSLTVWEPCCGRGAISEVLKAHGYGVVSTDLFDWDYPGSRAQYDFLKSRPPQGVPCIVTNPPFQHAPEFVQRAMDLGIEKVVMLLRLEFLAAQHKGLLDRHPPQRIYAFKRRLPMMHRDGWQGKKAQPRMNFAWYVWDSAATDSTTSLFRIDWVKASSG